VVSDKKEERRKKKKREGRKKRFEKTVKINKNRRGKEYFSGTIQSCFDCILTNFLLHFYLLAFLFLVFFLFFSQGNTL